MLITQLKLKNWKNFKQLEVALAARNYIVGANAAGKSNFLDVFRFLRDLCKPAGGGLQTAIEDRGGIHNIRSLAARRDTEIRISIELSNTPDDESPEWVYSLGFKPETKGAQRILVTHESAYFKGQPVLSRPDQDDLADPARLTQTAIEQINANHAFREVSAFFQAATYFHLVPQLLKHPARFSRTLEDDAFGQGLLHRIAKTPVKTRNIKLKRVQSSLEKVLPHFAELKFEFDQADGLPHLMASSTRHSPAAWQREDQFSDGTLRLIGLLWMLQENTSLLLLEEPELSLNEAIVAHLPLLIDRVLRQQKAFDRQVLITTHSEALLRNPLDERSVIFLEVGLDGTTARLANEAEVSLLHAGLTPAEVILPKARPQGVAQLGIP